MRDFPWGATKSQTPLHAVKKCPSGKICQIRKEGKHEPWKDVPRGSGIILYTQHCSWPKHIWFPKHSFTQWPSSLNLWNVLHQLMLSLESCQTHELNRSFQSPLVQEASHTDINTLVQYNEIIFPHLLRSWGLGHLKQRHYDKINL